jgi:hypothetical protein
VQSCEYGGEKKSPVLHDVLLPKKNNEAHVNEISLFEITFPLIDLKE